jgi:hypothetical protein
MKRFIRFTGLIGLMLLAGAWFSFPVAADNPIDMSEMSTDDIVTNLQEEFDSVGPGLHKGLRNGRSQRHGHPDPDAFEFLLELSLKKVPANPDTGFPEYYQVTGTLFPEIKFELRLPPRRDWNKKFYRLSYK